MYNLSAKKYLFFAISLIVIVPGVLALLFWHLNTGIDFTGGTTVDLRFQNALPSSSSSTISSTFATSGQAKDVKVYYAHETNINGQQIFWIKLNTSVDKTVQTEITTRLQSIDRTLTVTSLPPLLQASDDGGKTTYSLLPYQLVAPNTQNTTTPAYLVTADQVTKALTAKPLPATGPLASTTTGTTPSASPTPAAAATPTTKATPSATTTPVATGTPTAGAATGTTKPPTTTPVSLVKVFQGSTNQVVTIQTQTQLSPAKLQTIESDLQKDFGVVYQSQAQSVGPAIAQSTTILAIVAVIFASLAILVYIAIAFRNVGGFGQAAKYGACAVFALLHDALVVLGIWAILGHFFPNDFKVDTLFVTAVLTVIGFSVHDTIVVFDRIRENQQRRSGESFTDIVNASLLQTMARSLNTSLTVLITLSALTLFGGASIRSFTLALLIGIFSGTYSSIFNASMMLVVWESGEWRTWFGGKPKATAVTVRGQRAAQVGSR